MDRTAPWVTCHSIGWGHWLRYKCCWLSLVGICDLCLRTSQGGHPLTGTKGSRESITCRSMAVSQRSQVGLTHAFGNAIATDVMKTLAREINDLGVHHFGQIRIVVVAPYFPWNPRNPVCFEGFADSSKDPGLYSGFLRILAINTAWKQQPAVPAALAGCLLMIPNWLCGDHKIVCGSFSAILHAASRPKIAVDQPSPSQ